jgi:hypothetical protein
MEDGHVAALIEDFRAQFRVFGEVVQGTNDKLDTLDQRMTGLDQRMTGLEQKVDVVAADVSEVKERLKRVEHAMNGAPRKRKR